MSELGIFIDESGVIDFKQSKNLYLRDFYIVSFLFHNKSTHVDDEVEKFENFLFDNNLSRELPIHSMPLIRQQVPYEKLNREVRHKLFYKLFQFMRKLDLKHKTFVCDKKNCNSKQSLKHNLENYIEQMIENHMEYFRKFNEVVIYYDKGQSYLTNILRSAFAKNLTNYRFKDNVCQTEYRLLQCADMVCALELINQRKKYNEYIKSIDKFFKSNNNYNKNYTKTYYKLEL